MATEGYEAATLARIVDESQIPISSVYHYFGSKDGVLLAVMERGAQRFFERVPVSTALRGDPLAHLGWMVDEVCAALEDEPDFLRLVVVMAVQPPGDASGGALQVVGRVRSGALQRLRNDLAIALELRPGDRLVRDLARFVLAALDGAFVAWQADPNVRLRQVLKFLPTAVLAAADARRGSRRL
jgi:AcrR family transcriptional regulator